MNIHLFLKMALVFTLGAGIASAGAFLLGNTDVISEKNVAKVVSGEASNILGKEIQKKEKDGIGKITKNISDKILPAITENPIVQPFLQTKQDVSRAVESVTSLPDEQKKLLCEQVCSSSGE